MAADDDDEVGYGKPPKNHRFPKGQSGNPKGRPRKADPRVPSMTVLEEVLIEKLEMTVQGKRRKVSVGKAAVYRLVELAARGNASAARFLVDAQVRLDTSAVPAPITDADSANLTLLWVDVLEVIELLLASGALYLRRSGGFVFEQSSFAPFFANCGPEFMALSRDLRFTVSERASDTDGVVWTGDEPLLDLYIRLAAARGS